MVTRIVHVKVSVLLVVAYLRVARVGVVELLSFDHMMTSCKSRGVFLRTPLLLINQ